MARFWPKWCYNGRVMAREVSFYQCLWVTKLYAKFGCSRTPRTASAHKSFIVLWCMWKEPAPFSHYPSRPGTRTFCQVPVPSRSQKPLPIRPWLGNQITNQTNHCFHSLPLRPLQESPSWKPPLCTPVGAEGTVVWLSCPMNAAVISALVPWSVQRMCTCLAQPCPSLGIQYLV